MDLAAGITQLDVPALFLVGIGSREQERLTNLGRAVALAVRYSFDLFLQVRPELEKVRSALMLRSTTVFRGRADLLPISNVGQQVACLSKVGTNLRLPASLAEHLSFPVSNQSTHVPTSRLIADRVKTATKAPRSGEPLPPPVAAGPTAPRDKNRG